MSRQVEPVFRAAMNDPFGSQQQPSSRADYLMLTMLFVTTALWLAYEVPSLGNSGQTLGKRIMRIKVMALENTLSYLKGGNMEIDSMTQKTYDFYSQYS